MIHPNPGDYHIEDFFPFKCHGYNIVGYHAPRRMADKNSFINVETRCALNNTFVVVEDVLHCGHYHGLINVRCQTNGMNSRLISTSKIP